MQAGRSRERSPTARVLAFDDSPTILRTPWHTSKILLDANVKFYDVEHKVHGMREPFTSQDPWEKMGGTLEAQSHHRHADTAVNKT